MAKRGSKIKELAREFGVTSRRIIDHLRGEGTPVQNSVTRLDPETERGVRAWLQAIDARQNGDAGSAPRD